MAVSSEPGEDYGKMRVLQLPSNTTIPGPQQVQNNFESDPTVAQQLSLLRRGGSDVELGNLLSLPVAIGESGQLLHSLHDPGYSAPPARPVSFDAGERMHAAGERAGGQDLLNGGEQAIAQGSIGHFFLIRAARSAARASWRKGGVKKPAS